jgi:N-acetylglucosaminyl-diphospho-decaprenol L-rhamnosyltransferase
MPMSPNEDVGIAIVNYRTAPSIERQLQAWSRERPVESRIGAIIVVDNDAGELDTRIERLGLPVRYLRARGNRGYASGVNTGWRVLDHPYVLLLSPDAVISLASIDAMAAALDSEPALGAVAPLHLDRQGRPTNPFRRLPGWLDLLAHRTHLYRFEWAKRRTRRYLYADLDDLDVTWPPFDVEQPPASCLMLRSRAVSGDPMDERLPILFNDVDLSRRLRADGWRTRVIPDVTCRHEPATATRYLGTAAGAELYVGAYRYVRKWQGRACAELLRAGLIAEFALDLRAPEADRTQEARHAIAALRANRSLFDAGDDSDPVRRYWTANIE